MKSQREEAFATYAVGDRYEFPGVAVAASAT